MILALFLAVLAMPVIASAEQAGPVPSTSRAWARIGPDGGDVRILAVEPGNPLVVFAEVRSPLDAAGARTHRLFRSEDGGRSWLRLPFEGTRIDSLAVSPSSPATLYASSPAPDQLASTGERTFYRSRDGGTTWSPLPWPVALTGPVWKAVLRVDPGDDGTVFALIRYPGKMVARTRDAGASWTVLPIPGTPDAEVVEMGFLGPGAPVVATRAGTVYRGVEFGERMIAVGSVPSGRFGAAVAAFAVDPATPATFWAATSNVRGGFGDVFRSKDGGATWSVAYPAPGPDVVDAAIDGSSGTVIAGQMGSELFARGPRDADWRPFSITTATECSPPTVQGVVPAGDGATFFAGSEDLGGYRSDDLGATWSAFAATDLRSPRETSLDPSRPRGLFLTTEGDLFRSSDGGATWTSGASEPRAPYCPSFARVTADPGGSGVVYGIRSGEGIGSRWPGDRLERSVDGGVTWNEASPLAFSRPLALAVSPYDPREVYVSNDDDPVPGFPIRATTPASAGLATGGLYRSSDGGETFTREAIPAVGEPGILAVVFDPHEPGTVWAGGRGVFRKRPRESWQRLLPLIPRPVGSAHFGLVSGIAFDPLPGGAVYAVTNGDGVFRSLDGGSTWYYANGNLPFAVDTLYGTLFPAFCSIVVDPSKPSTVYAAAPPVRLHQGEAPPVIVAGGVFRSRDSGRTWDSLAEIPSLASATSYTQVGHLQLLLDGRGAPTLYAATPAGLFASDLSAPLRLDGVSPASGSSQGGTLLLVSGDGFRPDSVVTVGGAPTSELTFFGTESIRVRTGPHDPGLAEVAVTNPDGSRAVLPGAFAYRPYSCVPDESTLCLEAGRFRVTVRSEAAPARTEPLTIKSGFFWLSWRENPDVVVKILDGRTRDGHYWVHVAPLGDTAFRVVVTDTETGVSREYANAPGAPRAVIDRLSF
jgi:photosystem II stability/assembly factor-like uncharacterized protein